LAFTALPNDVKDITKITKDLSFNNKYSDKIDSASVNNKGWLMAMQDRAPPSSVDPDDYLAYGRGFPTPQPGYA
jgi:hypothetical protein